MTMAASESARPTRKPRSKGLFLRRYSTLIVLLAIFLAFAIGVDRFLSVRNLTNILQQISILTIVGVGLTFAFAAKEIDLSVGYACGLAGLLAPLLMVWGYPPALAVAVGLLAGLLVGVFNAIMVTVVGIPSLIATLASGSILFGVNFLVSGGKAIYGGIPESFTAIGATNLGGLPAISIVMLVVVAVAWFVMERSFLGRYIYAVGGNARAAELAGLSARRLKAISLVLCAVFAAGAGVLLAARLGSGQPNAGERYLLDGLATVFIGMTMIRPGIATVMGTLFGALFIGVINNGLNLIGLDTFIQDIFKGAIILAAVSVISRQTQLKLL
ncbi:ABC transporter permease [Chthonobacter albigriseus]|uniref:ABC transporter permease n=1 Tax=Chthonobacter albigriseus TaxID=1683161 RepID=UPI0015EFC041|nr:ABC transporter permease [Chthonobacter albigriseus]